MPAEAPIRLLLIEDNPADARLLTEFIRETAVADRFEIAVVGTLAEAAERLARGHPDLAVLDLGLPDSVGLDSFRSLRRHAPDVPVVVLTGLSDESLAIEAVREGAHDYLVKGRAEPDVLVRTLRHAVERHRAESEARRSAERLHTVVQHMPVLMIAADDRRLVAAWNRAAERATGLDAGDVVGRRRLEEVMRPGTGPDAGAGIPKHLARPSDAEPRTLLGADGRTRVLLWTPLEAACPVPGWAEWGIGVDVTDQARSEELLREIASGLSDRTGGDFMRTLVRRVAAVLDTDYAFVGEFLPEGHTARTTAVWGPSGIWENIEYDVRGTPCEAVVRGETVTHAAGVQALFPTDAMLEELGIQAYAGTPLIAADGRVIGLIGVFSRRPLRDSGVVESLLRIVAMRAGAEFERLRTETRLHTWRRRYESAVLASRQLLYDHDLETDAIVWGGSAEQSVGRPIDALGGTLDAWLDLVHPEDRPAVRDTRRRHAPRDEPYRVEYRVRRADGSYIYVEDRGHASRNAEGKPVSTVGFVADITARRTMEEHRRQSQKMEAIGQLASGVAHDFRNLMMAIGGNIDAVAGDIPAGSEHAEALRLAKEGVRQAGRVTDALLTFSRRAHTDKSTVRLERIVQDSAELLRRMMPANIDVRVDVPSEPVWVNADPTQMQQVLINLAINARDAMPDGGRLDIVVHHHGAERGPAGSARLIVRDTGTGMTPDIRARLFEPYFTTKPRGQGTGLGLPITHGIVHEHGGSLEIDSTPGAGSVFTVCLPCTEPRPEPELPAPQTSAALHDDADARPGGVVLLAEDNALVRGVVRSMLATLGFSVVEATTGDDAVRLFESAEPRPDLVVLDVDLPGRNGLDCLRHIRAGDTETPVLVITGRPDHRIPRNARTGMLPKPFQLAQLGAAIDGVLVSG